MTSESSSMTMKSDNESKLVNTATNSSNSSNVNNIKIYLNCTSSSSNSNSNSNKSTAANSLNSAKTAEAAAAPAPAVATATVTATSTATSDLPTITLAPFSKIKRETDSSDHSHTRHSSSMITKSNISSGTSTITSTSTNNSNSINISSSSSTSTSTSTSSSSNCNSQVPAVNPNSVSAKMGSRRIFTPQFKLQVLESYRNDSDCKGNQRATARKYNIHRRQIQKWLQCESNLRSSVANISANNVKHQFHNITHQMPIVTTSTLPSSASSSIHTNNNNNNNNVHHHHHAHHNQQQYKAINRLSLDTTRHSVALTSMPIATSKPTSGVLAAAAAVAAAAAAANIRDVGAVAPLSSPSSSSTSFLSSSTVKSLHAPTSPILHSQILSKPNVITVSPSALQCTKGRQMIGGPAAVPVLPPSLHSAYHHESMGIHTPPALLTSVPVSVPIITPHPHTHLHVANLKNHYQHHHHLHMEEHQHQHQLNHHHHHQQHLQQHHPHHQNHHHHPHHHHPYNQVPQPPPPPPPQQQPALSSERRPFVPSASLPVLPTSTFSSSSSSLSSSSSSSTTAPSPPAPTMTAVALSCTDTSETTPAAALSLVQAEENRIDELRDYQTTTTTTTSSSAAAAAATLVTENRYEYMNENEFAHSRTQQLHRAFEDFQYYMPLPLHMHPATTTAMIAPMDLSLGPKRYSLAAFAENSNNTTPPKSDLSLKDNQHEADDDDNEDSQLNVVDTDYSESQGVDLTLRKRKVHMSSVAETVSAEKQTKLSSDERDEKDTDKPHEPVKTFKLFKPYLLGEDDSTSTDTDKETADKISKQKDPIIWSHHTACLSPPISHESHQCSSRGSNFQSPPADAYPFPAGSPNFQPTPPTATTSSFRCPKGSPVSGYESSSSIYSDSASSSNGDHNNSTTHPHTTYSFDLKVHNINGGDFSNRHLIPSAAGRTFIGDGCIPFPPTTINHVQRWLDQESGIRPSIALYV